MKFIILLTTSILLLFTSTLSFGQNTEKMKAEGKVIETRDREPIANNPLLYGTWYIQTINDSKTHRGRVLTGFIEFGKNNNMKTRLFENAMEGTYKLLEGDYLYTKTGGYIDTMRIMKLNQDTLILYDSEQRRLYEYKRG